MRSARPGRHRHLVYPRRRDSETHGGKAAWRSDQILREGRDRREPVLEAGNVRPASLVESDMLEGQKAEISGDREIRRQTLLGCFSKAGL